jgi:hypothetical protein
LVGDAPLSIDALTAVAGDGGLPGEQRTLAWQRLLALLEVELLSAGTPVPTALANRANEIRKAYRVWFCAAQIAQKNDSHTSSTATLSEPIALGYTDFDGDVLRQAVQATFDRRQTALTGQPPFGLTDAFAQDAQKQIQWQAFLNKNRLEARALADVIEALATFMLPVIESASTGAALAARWPAGGPWLYAAAS